MIFTPQEQKKLRKFLERLNSKDVPYVILRDYRNLPHSVQGGDVDIFTLPNEFRNVISLAVQLNIRHNKIAGLSQIYNVGFSKPFFAIKKMINAPRYSVDWVNNTLFGNPADTLGSHEWTGKFGQLQVHLSSKMYYSSPWLGGKYQVNTKVQNSLISNRVFTGEFWVPSPPDHLVHLLCRGLFDRRGDFPEYYVKSCYNLYRDMNNDERDRLNELLRLVFFNADVTVENALSKKNLSNLLDNLQSYSNY